MIKQLALPSITLYYMTYRMKAQILTQLIETENLAWQLFDVAEERGYFTGGQTEKELSKRLYDLAFELFGIKKYWHKRIVRAGTNTLLPYSENPPNLTIENDAILFVDFGPVFDKWEADIGKTYVIGTDERKIKLKNDVENLWNEGCELYRANKHTLTGADFYSLTKELAAKYGWGFGNIHCGHLIGKFPHRVIPGNKVLNYLHPDNDSLMARPYPNGEERHWIYEVHLIDQQAGIGAFYERVLF